MKKIKNTTKVEKQVKTTAHVDVIHSEVAYPENIYLESLTKKLIMKGKLPKDFSTYITDKKLDEIDFSVFSNTPKILSSKTNSNVLKVITAIKSKNNDKLFYITRSAGFDHVANMINKSDIEISALPKYCINAVAQTAMTLVFDCLKNTNEHITCAAKGITENIKPFKSITNSTITIFGVGNIGFEIYKLAKRIGFKEVNGVDLREKILNKIYTKQVKFVSLEYVLNNSDIIINAMNLTTDINNSFYNKDYFNKIIPRCKKNIIFVNIARGEVVSSEILLKLLHQNKIYGIGLDVYSNEATLKKNLKNITNTKSIKKSFMNKEHKSNYKLIQLSKQMKANIYTHLHKAYNDDDSNKKKAEETMNLVLEAFNNKEFKKRIKNYSSIDITPI